MFNLNIGTAHLNKVWSTLIKYKIVTLTISNCHIFFRSFYYQFSIELFLIIINLMQMQGELVDKIFYLFKVRYQFRGDLLKCLDKID